MGTAVIAAAIVAPWLVWLPIVRAPGTIVVLAAVAIVGALHGWGRLVARAANLELGAMVAIYWGIAACIAISGVMIAMHAYDARLLVLAGAVAHAGDLALRFRDARTGVERALRSGVVRYWVIPVALIAVLAVVHVLASAGEASQRPFDDEANVTLQVERLAQTGTLDDALGFPRTAQLGGHVALSALVTPFADAGALRVVDLGIGFVLVLALACAWVRPRDPRSAIWATLIVVVASAFRIPWHDPAPLWIPAGLIAALVGTVEGSPRTTRSAIPIALIAGALGALRHELAPIAATFVIVEWWRGRRPLREDVVRLAVLAGALAVAAPYAVARTLAWTHVDAAAGALVAQRHGSELAALGLAIAIAAAVVPVLLLAVRELDASARWFAWAGAIGLAAVASGAIGQRPYAYRFLWPVIVAGLVVVAAAVARREGLLKIAMVVAFLACMVVRDDAAAFGRTAWAQRYYLLMLDAEYARHAAPTGGGYDRVMAAIPAGDTVAVWVARPELLDLARNHIVDLRTPRIAALRDANDDRFDRVVTGSRARWLVVERDDYLRRRDNASFLYRLACPRLTAACADRLEAYVVRGPRVASAGGVDVIALAAR